MARVLFQFEDGGDVSIFAVPGENLLEVARKANVAIDAPCSGNGSCGKCQVRLVSGMLKSEKTRHITQEQYDHGWRLACASTVESDVCVLVPDIAAAYKSRLKTADLSSPEELRVFEQLQKSLDEAGLSRTGFIRTVSLTLTEPTLDDTMPDNERFSRALAASLGAERVAVPFHVLVKLPDVMREGGFAVKCVVFDRGEAPEVLDVFPEGSVQAVCGLAVDIGTTTVSAVLVNLETGALLSKGSTGNGQIRFGADVINRIIEQQKPGGVDKLRSAIIEETLIPLIDTLCEDAGVSKRSIYGLAVASNTTMNHLLLGVSANYLRTEPYIPAFFELEPLDTADMGLSLAPGAKLLVAPNIGSYVGGDITAGTLSSMIWNTPELSMLIDLGTNGEIVLGNADFLMACACSAGPAFEGGDISCGMRATAGAIDAVTIDPETMEPALSVIGGGRPIGLCGSGLIDIVAELFRAGIINGKGKFVREGRRVRWDDVGMGSYVIAFPDESATGRLVAINEIDIDNFIRAKAAIFSATMTLLESLGFAPDDVQHISVAGGIGSGINIKNAVYIGMLPDIPLEKYRYIGNSSLAGAFAMLTSADAARKLHEVARSTTYLELSTQPGYMDAFVAACFLPHTDASLFPSFLRQRDADG